MNQKDKGLEVPVVLGIVGFFLLGSLSLGAGNEMTTSLIRGAIGMIALFLVGVVLRYVLRTFVGLQEEEHDLRGKHIDLVLPEHLPQGVQKSSSATSSQGAASDDDFVPLFQTARSPLQGTARDLDPEKIAEALRHLGDE